MTPTLAGKTFEWGMRTYITGIINATPDSFSGDGLMAHGGDWVAAAVAQGIRQEKDGADVLDVGGESTRPSSTPVSLDEELARVIPVIQGLAKEVSIPISIDTYKSEVARQAIHTSANIINNIFTGNAGLQRRTDGLFKFGFDVRHEVAVFNTDIPSPEPVRLCYTLRLAVIVHQDERRH